MNVTTDSYWSLHRLDIRFILQNSFGLKSEQFDVGLITVYIQNRQHGMNASTMNSAHPHNTENQGRTAGVS
jgi:hypothetical protein